MKALIVHAHYEPGSFTTSMKNKAVEVLTAAGHEVVVSDLYAMGFDPVAKRGDFAQPSNPDYIVYSLEQRHGYDNKTIAPDILAEVEKLLAADLVIFSFPVFWFSTPAIMKGWIDRVLLSGVTFGGRRFYDRGGLAGKKALMAATIGSRDHMFGADAIHGELGAMFSHLLRGTFRYVGMDVMKPYIAYHVPYISDDERRAILVDYEKRLSGIWTEAPMKVAPSLDDFDKVMRPLAKQP